jgi:hypothetical protein
MGTLKPNSKVQATCAEENSHIYTLHLQVSIFPKFVDIEHKIIVLFLVSKMCNTVSHFYMEPLFDNILHKPREF